MTYIEMKRMVARDLGLLSSDGTTIRDGLVTEDDIGNDINFVYRELLFPLISDKFPEDFMQTTSPLDTNIANGTVSASSTSTTLVASSGIFTNSMVGYQVYNLTDDEYATIEEFSNSTTVILDTTIGDTWDGDTIYVLGNEFSFGGSATDLKELLYVGIKYSPSDSRFVQATQDKKKNLIFTPQFGSKQFPSFYKTAIDVGGVTKPAIGIVPFPSNYNGKLQITYTEKPSLMSSDSDEPLLNPAGLSQTIVNGAIARGKRTQGKYDEAVQYEEMYERLGAFVPKGTKLVINSYSPRTKAGPFKLKIVPRYDAMRRRMI